VCEQLTSLVVGDRRHEQHGDAAGHERGVVAAELDAAGDLPPTLAFDPRFLEHAGGELDG